jgi:hypothetical protein
MNTQHCPQRPSNPSLQGTSTHVQVTRPCCLITTSMPPFVSLSIVPPTSMHISFGPYLAITSDHHLHRSPHNGPPFLLSTFPFILPIPFWVHCLVPRTISQYLSLPLTISSYTASLLVTPPYVHLFPFPFSIFLLSISFLLVLPLYIYLGSYSSIVLLVRLLFLHSSEHFCRSYWSIARLNPLDESDSIATSLCIYTYHEWQRRGQLWSGLFS